MKVGMDREPFVGDPGSFVVSRDHEDRCPGFRDLQEGSKSLVDQGRGDPGPVKDVPTVNHQVHPPLPGRRQGQIMVGHEVMAPTTAFHPGLDG
jgi:hypothetical protein